MAFRSARMVMPFKTKVVASPRVFAVVLILVCTILTPNLAANRTPSSDELKVDSAPISRTEPPTNPTARKDHLALRSISAPAAVAPALGVSANSPPFEISQRILVEIREIRAELIRKPNPWITAVITGIAGLLGGLLVAAVSAMTAARRERFDDLKAQRELALQALEQLMSWRLKQTEQFYGPLNALLGQSHGVYEQLRSHLIEQYPSKYRREADTFEVLNDNQWMPFRLLDEMPDVYDKETSAGPLIDEVMRVGERIVSTIHSHAGLARTETTELQPVLATYLAHYVVLNEMYKAVKKAELPAPKLRGRYTFGYFPRNFGELVRQDLASITAQLRSWESDLTSLAAKSQVGKKGAAGG